ncbi:hypothetical protein BKP64_00240 [Marinobacter salinus]|uniref:F5/8 type C domain-containing protein n=1 Tax=Marinobacter salinus TaxID=1874317 RepID=A0A1D9GGF8_9GAMM|nr:discoidin domain-containing protein [Marinobacter salinus]AOY86728.1 hypothetical protein BKP64_00240 [Marinobacter salinus]
MIRTTALVLVILLQVARTAEAMPPQAFVKAGENGQAVLMSRLNECYALTPAHVIGDGFFATLVGGSSARPRGEADLLQRFGYDLAVLRVTGAITDNCDFDLGGSFSLDRVLSTAANGQIVSVNSDGSLSRREVRVSDVGLLYLRVSPVGPENQLFKGLSGSLLALDDAPAGILMSVDPQTAEGKVLRFDRAVETVRPFFGMKTTSQGAESASLESEVANEGNLAEIVERWSSPAVSAEYRVSNLVDGVDAGTVWLAEPEGFPIEVVVDLKGDRVHPIDRVVLVGEGVTPLERLPRDFELLVSTREDGGWMPVFSGTYFTSDNSKLVVFAPVRARKIMLRIYSHWGDSMGVGLSDFVVRPE